MGQSSGRSTCFPPLQHGQWSFRVFSALHSHVLQLGHWTCGPREYTGTVWTVHVPGADMMAMSPPGPISATGRCSSSNLCSRCLRRRLAPPSTLRHHGRYCCSNSTSTATLSSGVSPIGPRHAAAQRPQSHAVASSTVMTTTGAPSRSTGGPIRWRRSRMAVASAVMSVGSMPVCAVNQLRLCSTHRLIRAARCWGVSGGRGCGALAT